MMNSRSSLATVVAALSAAMMAFDAGAGTRAAERNSAALQGEYGYLSYAEATNRRRRAPRITMAQQKRTSKKARNVKRHRAMRR